MIRRFTILFLVTLLYSAGLFAQDKNVELSVQFLSNDKIGDVNFDVEKFAAHGKKTIDLLEAFFAEYDKPQEIVILETFYPDKSPSFTIHARPAMLVTDMAAVLKKLNKVKAVRGLLVQFHLAYLVDIKGGIKAREAPYVPEMTVPVQTEFEALEDSSLSGKRWLIQQWAREEALPVLAAFASQADAKFEGVTAIGKLIREIDWEDNVNVIALNSSYWRAVLEMNLGNQLIPTSYIFLHVASGQFDHVKLFIDLLPSFADPKTVAGYFLKELKWRLDIFYAELDAQINGGILSHDAGKHGRAIKTYKRILKEYPNSAWALYELYFSQNSEMLKFKEIDEDDRTHWDEAKGSIYKANPLYGVDVRASTGREGYLIFRRAEIPGLFKNPDNINTDFVKLADIALDLEVYGFAAHSYWLALSNIPKTEHGDRELLYYFLYCLDKLGDIETKKNFEGDLEAEFKKIAAARESLMKESTIYKNFEKGE